MTNITLKTIYDAVQDLRKEVGDTYVTKHEFNPVKAIVFGMAFLILSSVFVALLAQVVRAI